MVAIMMIATTIQAQIPTNGLVAYYSFTGNVNDSSGNGNNGTPQNVSYTSDRFGNLKSCVNFANSNSNSQIDLGTSINPTQFTLSIWLNQTNFTKTGFNIPISKYYNSNGFEIQAAASMTLIVPNGTTWSAMLDTSSRYLNKWYHVVATFNGRYAKLYINGEEKKCLISPANTTYSDSLYQPSYSSGTNHLLVGNRPLDKSYNFHYEGDIDDIRIYNRALDSTEIQALYHEGGYNGNTLPIKLVDITASILGSDVVVKWQTSTELNTNHFIIQRSNDGINFTDLSSVKAIGIGSNNYQFKDLSPVNGTNYYRLKSIDKDGSYTYSKIISVNILSKEGFTIVPNPAVSNTTLRFNGITNSAIINVFNAAGKKVYTDKFSGISSSTYTLSTSKLSTGTYIVNVITKEGNYSNRLVITK